MSAYLLRRHGGTYYFRRAIPLDVRPAFGGRREWIVSLRTKDREQAKRILARYVLTFDEAIEAAKTGSSGNDAATLPDYELYPQISPAQPPKTIKVSLMATFDAYAKEQRLKPGTALEWRAMISRLVAFIGHDDVRRLTIDDLDRWRDHLLAEPSRRGEPRDPSTVKGKYISCIRATLNWAVDKRLLKENVAQKVVVRTPRKAKLRERDFTTLETSQILAASLLSPSQGINSQQALARRWIPWICAYTGARVNEISQLRGNDIKKVGDLWVMVITPEAGTVKGNSVRTVPLHPHLIEQGFVGIAQSHVEKPIFYDPTKIRKPEQGNRYYKKVGERLRDWVRDEVGITDPNVQPNHGWRHTFKTLMTELDIPERVADAIQGHAPRSAGQTYGQVPLKVMAKAIALIPRFIITSEES